MASKGIELVDNERYCRVGHVEIQDRYGNWRSYPGLDFRFDISYKADLYVDFNVGILGLSRETINELTVWDVTKSARDARGIRVYAGYLDGGESLIAEGGIWYAMPTNPPEMWLNLQCKKFLNHYDVVEKPRVVEGSPSEIFSEIASELGMKATFDAKNVEVEGSQKFQIEGRRISLPVKFAETYHVITYDKGGYLVCKDRNFYKDTPRNKKVLDVNKGLLSIGNVNIQGATITTRLNDEYLMMDWIELQSQLVPSANTSPYVVFEKRHKGHFRGNEWFTELKTFRYMRGTVS